MIPPHIPIRMVKAQEWCKSNGIKDMECTIFRYDSFGRKYLYIDFDSPTVYDPKFGSACVGGYQRLGAEQRPQSYDRFIRFNDMEQSVFVEIYGGYVWKFVDSFETLYDIETIIRWGLFPMNLRYNKDIRRLKNYSINEIYTNVIDCFGMQKLLADETDQKYEELKRVQLKLADAHVELCKALKQADVYKVGKVFNGSLPPEKWDKNIIEIVRLIERINSHSKGYEKYLKEFDEFFKGIEFDEFGFRKPQSVEGVVSEVRFFLECYCTGENRYDLMLKEANLNYIYFKKNYALTSKIN